jgi:hypothetical protein
MKRIFIVTGLFISLHVFAQDTTMNSLTRDMENKADTNKLPVKIFNSDKAINANTTEVVGKGKMDFKVTHNFDDIAGKRGGIKNFFGLDNSTDVRIGFHIGLTDRLNLNVAHAKGDLYSLRDDNSGSTKPPKGNLAFKLYEIALKYQLLRQKENDPGHPVAVTIFAQTVISTQAHDIANNKVVPDQPNSFESFKDRMSQVFQVIIAKKIGKASVQLNPTLVHYNYVPTYDDATTFALGGAARIPLSRTFAIIVDYFHPFISDTKKNNYYDSSAIKFHDPLGIGVEITTAGHIFHLNFTNSTGILENQFIPYTTTSWGKGQYRWGFTISRRFVLWREKK